MFHTTPYNLHNLISTSVNNVIYQIGSTWSARRIMRNMAKVRLTPMPPSSSQEDTGTLDLLASDREGLACMH